MVIDCIERWQKKIYKSSGCHFIHASDEWYILAGRDFPEEERYDGYLQLENGVGMMRLLYEETRQQILGMEGAEEEKVSSILKVGKREISLATGKLAAPHMERLYSLVKEKYSNVVLHIYEIENRFFGERITVSGLITGTDLSMQLKGKELGTELLLPVSMMRSGEKVFLDDMTVEQLENALQIKVRIVKSSGCDFVKALLGLDDEEMEKEDADE